ncbi:unnamed protein product [Trifolium pratense]|uniref:Uncharacterized protein n=1 Tax=Trifolium pratense TaxID=57577 RepID=A0ACB0KX56_TRIPR|nr:unnamed protein product [Trifolium pratense]
MFIRRRKRGNKMYKYLCSVEKEKKRRPKMDYMKILQKDITPHMRGQLIDWLAELADNYNLLPNVIYLAVSYIDRYLSFHPIRKVRLQLLGVTSMYIASKYEDLSTHNVETFSVTTCNYYDKEEVLEMENKILKTLDFDLSSPTIMTFLEKFEEIACEENNASSWKFKFLTEYLGELSLLEYECLKFLPSLVAASITLLAKFIVWPEKRPCWTSALEEYSEYSSFELKECVLILHDLYMSKRGACFKAIRKKYSQQEEEPDNPEFDPELQNVANLPSPSKLPSYLFEVEAEFRKEKK